MKELTVTEKPIKVKKERKPITIKLSTIALVVVSLAIGAFIGIVSNNAINTHINSQVKEQVTSFTEAQE
jgi:hypothetical protein